MTKLLISGFLGSGKTMLGALFTGAGWEVEELDGLLAAPAVQGGAAAHVATVIDCANAERQWADPVVAPLIRRQVETAGIIVLTRTDIASADPVRAELATLTTAPVFEVPLSSPPDVPSAALPDPVPADDLSDAFETWEYRGGARLNHKTAESLAETRPKGLIRLSARLRTDGGGLEIEIAGRVRQTQAIEGPHETTLTARGPRAGFPRQTLDRWFAEAVADSSHSFGMFGYR